jgi:hypothetical protein
LRFEFLDFSCSLPMEVRCNMLLQFVPYLPFSFP